MKRLLSVLLCFVLLLGLAPVANAATAIKSDLCPDLSEYIQNTSRRIFMQQTISYYLRHDATVRKNLENGYCAIFLFEGCSDNMDHPEYQDISYYRVSAACLVLKLNKRGMPEVTYYNGNCSTLPDRPADYAPRKEEVPADVGPATIRDGTYEVFSVLHGGKYEALHMRTTQADETIPAIYLTPHGYTEVLATKINLHTRTNNHILKNQMWSEGCILMGSGEWEEFEDFIASTYYQVYPFFILDLKVGSVTINRQLLRDQMYRIYEDQVPVDYLLESSDPLLPQTYLDRCGPIQELNLTDTLWTTKETQVMSLPCGNATDARSVPVATLEEGAEVEITRAITNSREAVWYLTKHDGMTVYIYSGDCKEPTETERFWRKHFE